MQNIYNEGTFDYENRLQIKYKANKLKRLLLNDEIQFKVKKHNEDYH